MTDGLVIEKGIPLPPASATESIKSMEVGDSFLAERPAMNFAPSAKKLGFKLSCRKQPDGKYRIWRVA